MTGVCDAEKWREIDVNEYVVDYLANKPEPAKSNNFVNEMYKSIKPDDDKMRIALLTDFHVDYDYTAGMSNECTQILCCRSASGLPKDPT